MGNPFNQMKDQNSEYIKNSINLLKNGGGAKMAA